MEDKTDKLEDLWYRQGKVIAHLEDLTGKTQKIDDRIVILQDNTTAIYNKIIEQTETRIKAHAETCPAKQKLDLFLKDLEDTNKKKTSRFRFILTLLLTGGIGTAVLSTITNIFSKIKPFFHHH